MGDLLAYKQEGEKLILDTRNVSKEHVRKLIEESFSDSSKGSIYHEEDMKNKFGKYG